jgi:hypothetical protein
MIATTARREPAEAQMVKTTPFHTITPGKEKETGHRGVYHDNRACSDGKRILAANKKLGTDRSPKCDEFITLS